MSQYSSDTPTVFDRQTIEKMKQKPIVFDRQTIEKIKRNVTYTNSSSGNPFDVEGTPPDTIWMWDHTINIDYEDGKVECTSCEMEEELPDLPGELRNFHEIIFRIHILGKFRESDCGSMIDALKEDKIKRDNLFGPDDLAPTPNPYSVPSDDPGFNRRIYWSK